VPLHVEVRGDGPPLVLLHGFTQTARLWGSFGDMLTHDHTLLAIDLPGHGGSDEVRADLPTTATLVQEAVRATIGTAPCDLLGYSLGARVALHVAVGTELDLSHIVVIGATAGIEDPAARQRRRESDESMATDLEGSGDVGAFIDRWVSSPMFARLAGSAQAEERRRNSAAGLASSLRLAGLGTQEPQWHLVPSVSAPLLAVAGTDDARFAAHALRLVDLAPNGVASLIPGGGHAVHLAQPQAAWRLIHHWLAGPHKEEADGQEQSGTQLEA
jgi:2-succinyl-6-hydroxy-2,4-cyclohexadiene-1-carboxylate synthase